MGEEAPNLELQLTVRTPRVFRGEQVVVELRLTNRGQSVVEVASLAENNEVTNYVLSLHDGTELGTVNELSRQKLLRLVRPVRGQARRRTLQPGETESHQENLALLYPFLTPDQYRVQGRYLWRGLDLTTPPQPFAIVPPSVVEHDAQWAYHYGEEYYLHSSWVHRDSGAYRVVLREAFRFDPWVLNYDRQVFEQADPIAPRVSFNQSLLAGGGVWLAWLSEGSVHCLRCDDGNPAGPPCAFPLDGALAGTRIVSPPLRLPDDSLLILLEGTTSDGELRVEGLLVEGTALRSRRQLAPHFTGALAGSIRTLLDEDGRCYLLWRKRASGGDEELWLAPFDPTQIEVAGSARCLERCADALLGVLSPVVVPPHETLVLLSARPAEGAQSMPPLVELWLQRLPFRSEEPPPSASRAPIGPISLSKAVGQIDRDGAIHLLLLTEDRKLLYWNDHRAEAKTVAELEEADLPTPLALTVNAGGEVWAVFRRAATGLEEQLVRQPWEDD